MAATPKKNKTSPYDAPGHMLRSDMPDGYAPESRVAPPTARYPMLRAMRWILRIAAAVYLLVSAAQAANMLGLFDSAFGGRPDERSVTYPEGSQRKPDEVQAYVTIMVGFSAIQNLVYSIALLALAEAIQLGLDVREQQQRTAPAPVG
jgi:hypothetical protein